ncbi:MAG: RNHCP domain-containing protein [Candidatus Saccharimonadales bacterium]
MSQNDADFNCLNCAKTVTAGGLIGTKNRNHCPWCLWSRHVDDKIAGDRSATCQAGMRPLGLTFKDEGLDKYGRRRPGELMLIHDCTKCGKLSINRIAADDQPDEIINLLKTDLLTADQRAKIAADTIELLDSNQLDQVKILLFGRRRLNYYHRPGRF